MSLLTQTLLSITAFIIAKIIHWSLNRSIDKIDAFAENKGIASLDLSNKTKDLINRLSKYVLYSIAFLVVLYIFHLDNVVMSIITAAGVSGIAISFAARDIFSNALSGLFLMFDKPFSVGDEIEIKKMYVERAIVKSINIRSTVLKTLDGKVLTIPNSVILSQPIINYSTSPIGLVDLTVEVDVDSRVKKAITLIDKIVDNLNWKVTDPSPKVFIEDVNKDNVVIHIKVWTSNERVGDKKAELFYKVRDSLKKANIKSSVIRD